MMSSAFFRKTVVIGLFHGLCLTPYAFGQEDSTSGVNSTYSFSGACSTQGSWTQAALSQTQRLKEILVNLKDNPACQSLKSSMINSLQGMEQNLTQIQKDGGDNLGRLSSLPNEITGLRTFMREKSAFRADVIQVLMGKAIEQTALTSKFSSQNSNSVAESVLSLGKRVKQSSMTGINLFNSTLSSLQQTQANCMDDAQGASAISAMVQMLSSFASSGQTATGSQLAMAVQNLGQYMGREKKYVDALRKLNDREFITSMSCLMEVTSEGFCSTLDARYLLEEITDNHRFNKKEFTNSRTGKKELKIVGESENFKKVLEKGPLAGYYILSRQVPIITDWIQKVQYGITPQLPTEATFKIDTANNVQGHLNSRYGIEGTYNMQMNLLKDLKDFNAKQTYVLQMVKDVASSMSRGGGSSENFYSKVSSDNELMFRLLGMQVPGEVLGDSQGGNMNFLNNPSGWLDAKYRKLPDFSNPEQLALRVKDNMQTIFKQSTDIAIAYYNKYFIVDKLQVINDSLLGLDSNVRDALVNIDQYLKNLSSRIVKEKYDPTILPIITQTRVRIGRILARYSDIRTQGLELVQKVSKDGTFTTLDEIEMDKNLRKLGDSLMQEVYDQFEILLARSGWLSNRMAGFVLHDYTMSLKKRDYFDQYTEDLMFATGYSALNQMMNTAQIEFSKSKLDMDRALNIYQTNLNALEEVSQSVFTRHILNLKMKALNKNLTEGDVFRMTQEAAFNKEYEQVPGEETNKVQRYIRGKLHQWWTDASLSDSEQYGAPGFSWKINPFSYLWKMMMGQKDYVITPGSHFGTAQTEMSLLCTQTLAFPNMKAYWGLCKEAVLLSPLHKQNIQDTDLKKLLNDYLSVNYIQKAYENIEPSKAKITGHDRGLNFEARVCALRDYNRRNEVAKVTAAMRDDGDTYKNEFTKVVEETVELVPNTPKMESIESEEDSSEEGLSIQRR